MTKNKCTKRALLLSALSLLLCVSMLVGSTFAWFTDSVTSSGNIIKSGTLDVTMEWADGTKAVPADDSSDWKNAAEGAIFKSELWEPGYTEVRHIKIANEGTLALKYQLNILANSEVSELADVIDVYYVDPAVQVADRTALADDNKLGTLTEVLTNISTTASGNLKATEKHTITLALKMQESAGNEYQDLAIGSDFSIQLLATQLTAETDSFDNQYDANATLGTYVELNAGDDLLAAMASAEADMPLTIKLNGNVEWPTEGHHGENDITPASSILIDGNGYTITATGAGVTPLGDKEAPMTLKNVKIVDNSVSYAEGAWEFTYLELGGTKLICNNVTFADEIQPGTNAIFTNCSFESNEQSVYAVWVEDGSATFTNCTFTGYRGLKAHEDYGTEISSVIVKDCTFSNITKKPGIALGTLNADTSVSITGSTFINCQAGDQALYIYETDTDISTINFTAENNTVKFAVSDMSGLDAAIKSGAKVIDAQGANLGDFYYDAKFTDGVTVQNAKFTYFYGGNVEGTVTFENCEFVSDHSYSANFDSGNGNIIFNNCLFDGWNSFGTAIKGVEMNNCTFRMSYNYGILRFYQNAELNNCTFEDSFEGVDTNVTGTEVHFNNCTGIESKIFNNGDKVGKWFVDGVDISDTVTSW